MILCVAANPSTDRLFAVDGLVPGAIHRPTGFVQVAGGKGLNVARAAAQLGGDVRAAALLGGHAGRWIADELAAEGVDLHAAWTEVETRSSLSVAGADEGLTEFYEHGFPVASGEWAAFANLVAGLASETAWMTLSGSLPPGAPEDGYVELVPLTRTALDSRAAGIDARPAVVKLNEAEAGVGADGAGAAARALHERSGGAAIVTRGRDGAVLVTPDGTAMVGRLDAEGAYPVGSGDAFLAGLVVALDGGAGWPDALRAALGAGAANAAIPGAGRLDRGNAERLAGQARIATE
ncbi:MAG TPA: PfkB family carbohydrate kinase [Gaiellales bacterium]|nr:PfkB family carbohydrate kinase [Gaiellales bacterium]